MAGANRSHEIWLRNKIDEMRNSLQILILFFTLTLRSTGASINYSLLDTGPFQGFTLSGTITTDGTLGVVAESSVLSWSITASDGISTVNFDSQLTNNIVRMYGTSLNATSTNLFLPEGSALSFLLDRPTRDLALQWDRRNLSGNQQNRFLMYDDAIPRVYFSNTAFFTESSHGVAAVPEPCSLMFTGGGCILLCIADRRRKRS